MIRNVWCYNDKDIHYGSLYALWLQHACVSVSRPHFGIPGITSPFIISQQPIKPTLNYTDCYVQVYYT